MKFSELVAHHKRIFPPLTPYEGDRQLILAVACLMQLMGERAKPYSVEEIEQLQQCCVLIFVALLNDAVANKMPEAYGLQFDEYKLLPAETVSLRSVGEAYACAKHMLSDDYEPQDSIRVAFHLGLSKGELIKRYLELSQGMQPPVTPEHRAYAESLLDEGWAS